MLTVTPRFLPPLDPEFLPAVLWTRAFLARCAGTAGSRDVAVALERPDGTVSVFHTRVLPDAPEHAALNRKHLERLVKFLLWQCGGARVIIGGAPELVDHLRATYCTGGAREFDYEFLGRKVYGSPLQFESRTLDAMPAAVETSVPLGRNLDGCRIGFDLGGSDRKCAAVIDGQVVFSEEVPWDPYFQSDPAYHREGINDTLRRAAAHLPRVDAIGGSSAGVYVNNEIRAASLFRGVSDADFEKHVRRLFFSLKEEWGGIPFEVVNDGEVTALAGSMSMGENAVLGVSLGTSQAAGYVGPDGNIRPWLNELAFAPIDYRDDAPLDEWSGDRGCGVQYFSQQGVARLAPRAGLDFPADMPFPERLVEVQKLMAAGDDRARRIFETIGICFGYAVAHYAAFYEMKNLLILGRVTSGEGGAIVIDQAKKVLATEFPELTLTLRTPDEAGKRHGQAVAAASLPKLG